MVRAAREVIFNVDVKVVINGERRYLFPSIVIRGESVIHSFPRLAKTNHECN